jgi:hypothetical protein
MKAEANGANQTVSASGTVGHALYGGRALAHALG